MLEYLYFIAFNFYEAILHVCIHANGGFTKYVRGQPSQVVATHSTGLHKPTVIHISIGTCSDAHRVA